MTSHYESPEQRRDEERGMAVVVVYGVGAVIILATLAGIIWYFTGVTPWTWWPW